jgi:hypothetical protein
MLGIVGERRVHVEAIGGHAQHGHLPRIPGVRAEEHLVKLVDSRDSFG